MSARARVSALALVVGAFCAWLGLRDAGFPEPEPEPVLSAPPAGPTLVAARVERASPPAQPLASAAVDLEHDGAPPHPITPERARLQRELQLIGALNDAMDLGDAARLRELVARYREHDPSDEQALQAGYEIVADCLEQPGEAARQRAQEYYERERASTLRRYLRRHCLE